ncbi:hypothetical protein [Flavobacterium caseinilyticum]|uniref:Uncharacterized protein n=1 Tax=Flavobacterium caseinilyticum TaxID=2541732 RepID=A0A4R5B0V2_9FLAO|nr:hypothetical protein [Flavobacterium caseinilyticum]TDD77154.1 hypothetical protein E0F89_06020 [Flavobacterium caseinilyticum]
MKNNTSASTKDLSTKDVLSFVPEKPVYTIEEMYQGVVGHPNGNYYKIAKKDLTSVYLSLIEGNQLTTCPAAMLSFEVANGTWKFYAAGDDSWKEKVYTEEVMAYKNNVLKSLIYNQLAVEANDNLIETVEHDPYLNNLLKKANKGLERKANKHLSQVYGADPQMLTNIFNAIDGFVSRMAKSLPHEFFYLNSIYDEYNADPTKYIGRQIMLDDVNIRNEEGN